MASRRMTAASNQFSASPVLFVNDLARLSPPRQKRGTIRIRTRTRVECPSASKSCGPRGSFPAKWLNGWWSGRSTNYSDVWLPDRMPKLLVRLLTTTSTTGALPTHSHSLRYIVVLSFSRSGRLSCRLSLQHFPLRDVAISMGWSRSLPTVYLLLIMPAAAAGNPSRKICLMWASARLQIQFSR